ncbi:neprilysin-4-like [Daktulosphaira vitifoliae]|uniref:neprilysin-4-like n=1 Tax=Daktulosphaira vitifoliae TaxID=58002 RepID=UPI0021AA2885|nr:neprilysin-4-like [Daktulosphaira vitifoliae]
MKKEILFSVLLSLIKLIGGRSVNDFMKDVFSIDDNSLDEECTTMECQTSKYLLNSMNRSIDPCVDFYEYSCGSWGKEHQVTSTKSSWYQYKEAERDITKNLKDLLEAENNDEIMLPAKKFYKSCMNSVKNKMNIEYLKSVILLFGGWPIGKHEKNNKLEFLDWTKIYIYLEKNWKIPTILETGITVNYMNTSQYILMIDQPDMMLPVSMFLNPSKYSVQISAYSELISGTVLLVKEDLGLGSTHSNNFGDETAHEIIELETKIAKLQNNRFIKKSEKVLKNRIMTIAELQTITDFVSNKFRVDWLKMFQLMFKGTDRIIKDTERIIVRDENFLKELIRVLEQTSKRIIINYMSWCLLRSLLTDIREDLRNLVNDFNIVFTGEVKEDSRWENCVMATNSHFTFNIGYTYINKYFDEPAKNTALEMVNNIQQVYLEQLENVPWMDSITRKAAIDKLQSIHKFVAYPDWFKNSSLLYTKLKTVNVTDSYLMNLEMLQASSITRKLSRLHTVHNRDEWTMDIVSVNGYNDIYSNAIVLPVGMLHLPFYHNVRIQALNYGMVGLVVGHEIMHAFDDSGRMYDKKGNRIQWWTKETLETFSKKAECFVQQYNNYYLKVLGNQINVNGLLTQNENIADIGGLSHAYLAYQKYISKHGTENRLPGLEDLTPEQLFFVGFASIWCESTTEQSLLNDLLSDVHSPGRIRVLGTLSNSIEFAKVFQCPVGSPMNPLDKCIIW